MSNNNEKAMNSKIRDRVIDYLYRKHGIISNLRDGIFDKPEGTEILLKYAEYVNCILCNGEVSKESINEVLYFVDVTKTLQDYEDKAPWIREVVQQMDNILLKNLKLKKEE